MPQRFHHGRLPHALLTQPGTPKTPSLALSARNMHRGWRYIARFFCTV